MKEIKTDVLVIGSGVAGIMAALTAARLGCEVVLVSKLSLRSGNSGLFAAGEVTSGVHGANRLRGNALAECLIFGEVAGESDARHALEGDSWKPRLHAMRAGLSWGDKTGHARTLLQEVQNLMWLHAGPIRNAESL